MSTDYVLPAGKIWRVAPPPPDPLQLLDTRDMASIFRLSLSGFRNRLHRNPSSLPPRVQAGSSKPLWSRAVVERWLEERSE